MSVPSAILFGYIDSDLQYATQFFFSLLKNITEKIK